MEFRVCCCLYDHYFYGLSTKSFFTIYSDTYRQKDHGFTSTFCMDGEFAQARYKCIYNAILIKKFDEVKINQLLNQTCQIYFARSSYFERINGTAKSCFKITRHFLQKSDITININFVVTNCCFTCFKNFIFNFLSDEFYYVSNRLNVLQK